MSKCLNVESADLAGLPLSTLGAMTTIGSYYYLQPLGDVLALTMGLEYTPLVTVGNMVLIVLLNPVYAAIVRQLPTASVLPFMFRAVSAILLAFAITFHLFAGYKPLSFGFAIYVGTISLFTTTTFYGRLASLHTKAEAKRVYGVIAAGGQSGQLLASFSASVLFSVMGNSIVLCSAVLYECASWLMYFRGHVGAAQVIVTASSASKHVAKGEPATATKADGEEATTNTCSSCFGSAFGGFWLLVSTPFLRAITVHTLLITFLVSGVWYERAAAVSAAFTSDEDRYTFFSALNAIVGTLTLVIQALCFSHVLQRGGFHGTLTAEPIAMAAGLCAVLVHPGLLSIALLDGLRKVVHYSLVKPTKEGLYAALPKDTVFIAKPLLDTLVYRTGSLIGAGYFTAVMGFSLTPKARQCTLLVVTFAWLLNSWWLGVLAERQQREQEVGHPGQLL